MENNKSKQKEEKIMDISEIINGINRQNSLENLYCIAKIQTDNQLKDLKKRGYLVDYTKKTFEEAYPGIPAERMYCVKCELLPVGLCYLDKDHGIFFQTHIYGKKALTDRETELRRLKRMAEEMEAEYRNKNYKNLFWGASEQSGNITLALLSHLIEKEEPSDMLYDAFIRTYTSVDYGGRFITKTVREKLLLCKSEKRRMETERRLDELSSENGRITVYRGQGTCSQEEGTALSWTTNLGVALFFASRFGTEQATILEGTVAKKDVIEYIAFGSEQEVLIPPGKVTIKARSRLFSLEEFVSLCWESEHFLYTEEDEESFERDYNVNSLLRRILTLYSEKEMVLDHGEKHSCNVTLLACALFSMNAREYLDAEELYEEYKNVVDAAIYHDIGRINGADEASHGIKSYLVYRDRNGENPVVQFLIENHCTEDADARKVLKAFPEEKRERLFELLGILKDADALDRVRFSRHSPDYLNPDYLHEKEAFRLVKVAGWMQQQSYDEWRQ
mgnify:CR=1 FL=1